MKRKKREKESRKFPKCTAALLAVLLLCLLLGGLLAKYRSDDQRQAQLTASEFHFTSDYLEETIASYTITDWQDGFDIQLYNYEKENTAQITQEDITYRVSLSGSTNWNSFTDSNDGKFAKSTEKKIQKIHINAPVGASQGDTVTVEITTTAPFVKTLSATFTMAGKNQPDYTITDQGDGTVALQIQSNGYSGELQISWAAEKYDPDNTNQYMRRWADSSPQGTISVEKNTTYELLFFKNTTENVTTQRGSGTSITVS